MKRRAVELMMTEQKIRQLHAEVAMMQTARQAYANALKASLVRSKDQLAAERDRQRRQREQERLRKRQAQVGGKTL